MDRALRDILKEALDKRQRKETLERSLGQAVRAAGKDFSVYIGIMAEVREFAREHTLSEIEAALQILRESDDEPKD
jgi:hypothetical protein